MLLQKSNAQDTGAVTLYVNCDGWDGHYISASSGSFRPVSSHSRRPSTSSEESHSAIRSARFGGKPRSKTSEEVTISSFLICTGALLDLLSSSVSKERYQAKRSLSGLRSETSINLHRQLLSRTGKSRSFKGNA